MKTMKIFTLWMYAAIFLCGISMTSCHDNENDVIDRPEPVYGRFFTPTINKMIDVNYQVVQARGYGELVIPAELFDKSLIYLPKVHCETMDIMAAAGYKTYVNGGAVRDAILGTPIHDVDFSTDATPERMVEIVPNAVITNTGGGQIAQARHPDGDVTDMVPIRGIDIRLQGKPGLPPDGAYGQNYSKKGEILNKLQMGSFEDPRFAFFPECRPQEFNMVLSGTIRKNLQERSACGSFRRRGRRGERGCGNVRLTCALHRLLQHLIHDLRRFADEPRTGS